MRKTTIYTIAGLRGQSGTSIDGIRVYEHFKIVLGRQEIACFLSREDKNSLGGLTMYCKHTVVSNDLGEVITDKTLQYKGRFDVESGYLFWSQRNFVKSFPGVELPGTMRDDEIGKMDRLSHKVFADTNMLAYKGRNGIVPFGMKDIEETLKLGQRQTYRFVDKMLQLGIMARLIIDTKGQKTTQYYLNPMYYFSSNRLSLNLYLLFQDQLNEVLPKYVIANFQTLKQQKEFRQ